MIACLTLLLPMEGYVQPAWATRVRDELLSLDWFSSQDSPGTGSSDTPSGTGPGSSGVFAPEDSVDLSAAGPRRYTGQAVLEVTGTQPGTIYLRGPAYRDYTGTSWDTLVSTPLSTSQAGTWQSWNNALLDSGAETVTVTPRASSAMAYLPYQATRLFDVPISQFTTCSTLLYSNMLHSYTVHYLPLEGEPVPFDESGPLGAGGYLDYLTDYRLSSVDWQYLYLPNAGNLSYNGASISFLNGWLQQAMEELEESGEPVAGGYTGPYAQELNTAALIAQLLERSAEYDLNTPVTPEGEDFVVYFLEESRRGYCVHFASAATLLLRLQGIHARYVTGYTASIPENGGTDTVRDSDAHAWVEIFLDGYGWYPVEVTPAARAEDNPYRTPAPTLPPSQTPEASLAPEATSQPGDAPALEESGGNPPAWLLLLLPLILALTAPNWLPGLLTRLIRAWWTRLLARKGPNAAALAAYRRLGWWERQGGKLPPRATALAEKARFSQHTLTGAELEELLSLLAGKTAGLGRALPPWRRSWLKLFFTALGAPPPDIPT